jgi:TRAP-type C4-dicarboxylate transport system permease small subunit
MVSAFANKVKRASHFFGHLEKWVVVCLFSLLTIISVLQIIMRNFFSAGLVWGDDLLRHGVLWLSFLGAALATQENKHIRIDILPRLMAARGRFITELVCAFFSCLVTLVLFWASWNFVQSERLHGDIAFAAVPYWYLEVVFPLSFALMAFRFGFAFVSGLIKGMDRVEI